MIESDGDADGVDSATVDDTYELFAVCLDLAKRSGGDRQFVIQTAKMIMKLVMARADRKRGGYYATWPPVERQADRELSSRIQRGGTMIQDFLHKLTVLSRNNRDIRALLREFVDAGQVIAYVECDEVASRETGALVVRGAPSEAFGRALTKIVGADGLDLNGRPEVYKTTALPD